MSAPTGRQSEQLAAEEPDVSFKEEVETKTERVNIGLGPEFMVRHVFETYKYFTTSYQYHD